MKENIKNVRNSKNKFENKFPILKENLNLNENIKIDENQNFQKNL